jgi:hypothetical protein
VLSDVPAVELAWQPDVREKGDEGLLAFPHSLLASCSFDDLKSSILKRPNRNCSQ